MWLATAGLAAGSIWCQVEMATAFRLSFFGFSEVDPNNGVPTQQADIARMVRLQYLPDIAGGLLAAAGACLAASLGIHALLWARKGPTGTADGAPGHPPAGGARGGVDGGAAVGEGRG